MRVRINYTVEVDDKIRRAINAYYGKDGLATREEIKSFYEINGGTLDEDIIHDYDTAQESLEASLTNPKIKS